MCQARDFNYRKAEDMLHKHLEWRKATFPLTGDWLHEELESKKVQSALSNCLCEWSE